MASKSPGAFRTIGEVAQWLGVPPHVLRFWESKFSQVRPVKKAGGRRYYRPDDMILLGGIKVLLHDKGMTIKGVQRILEEDGLDAVGAHAPELEGGPTNGVAIDGPAAAGAAPEEADPDTADLFDGDVAPLGGHEPGPAVDAPEPSMAEDRDPGDAAPDAEAQGAGEEASAPAPEVPAASDEESAPPTPGMALPDAAPTEVAVAPVEDEPTSVVADDEPSSRGADASTDVEEPPARGSDDGAGAERNGEPSRGDAVPDPDETVAHEGGSVGSAGPDARGHGAVDLPPPVRAATPPADERHVVGIPRPRIRPMAVRANNGAVLDLVRRLEAIRDRIGP